MDGMSRAWSLNIRKVCVEWSVCHYCWEVAYIESEMNGPYKDTFVRVQEYEGDGYKLRGGEEADM
jgi:hypothetical protein